MVAVMHRASHKDPEKPLPGIGLNIARESDLGFGVVRRSAAWQGSASSRSPELERQMATNFQLLVRCSRSKEPFPLPDDFAGPACFSGADFQGLQGFVSLAYRIAGRDLRGEKMSLIESDQESSLGRLREAFDEPRRSPRTEDTASAAFL
jgi:hypothetical protein